MVPIGYISNLTLGELFPYIVASVLIIKYLYDFFTRETNVHITKSSQLNASQSIVGVASSEELFEELDPPRESKVFKGREQDIVKLEALFFGKDVKRKVVLHGLPGFGKTELAVRFAKHCLDSKNIDKTFWVNAETSENLKSLHKTLKKVYKNFENKRCLFIFDNGISRSSIRQYEPPDIEHFYLLITSHVADWDDDIYQMSLKPLNTEASIDVFREILGGRYQENEKNIYKELIAFVSNVPLGLIIIAGHLRFKMDACKQRKFNTNHFFGEISKVLHCQSSYQGGIYSAMIVALEKMYKQDFADSEKTRGGSIAVLGICAYLNPDAINIREIKEIMECSQENIVDECVYLLENFSFIQYNDGVIKIHRLCQKILKLYFDETRKDYYSVCLRWLLRTEYWHNRHEYEILMEADNKKETVLDIYQQNVSKNHYRYIEKLLRLLVLYGCFESCELIFHKINFKQRKQFVDNMKLLHVAVESNQADLLKLFLEYCDLNFQNNEGSTPLHIASWKGNSCIVRILLEKGADVHVLDNEGNTPLHWASLNGNIDTVRMLLDKGADVHILDNEGNTPLHIAFKNRNVDIVRMLLQKRADVHVQDNEGKTPLHWASRKGNTDIMQMLLQKGADVHVRDSEGKTPLHWASQKGSLDIVRMLLEKGADVHFRDNKGKAPLHWASQIGNTDIVRMLLDKGADVHVRDSKGKTPLHWASQEGNLDIVRMLLYKGADVHVCDSKGKTPLHWASQEGNLDIVRMLLYIGADVQVRDSEGKTPLHWASQKGSLDIVRMLLEKGADVHFRDNEGKAPLHWASQIGNTDIVRMLLDKGADVHVRDSKGKTHCTGHPRKEI